MNRLFVVNKPIFIGSNSYLGRIKRKYKVKKAGFSGTLDPFASGCLIVAFGKYTRLFNYLKKTPKTYRATLWLGVQSDSLDIENLGEVRIKSEELKIDDINEALLSLLGEIEYIPPKFSAKKIDGKRAYELARDGKEVELKKSKMNIYDIKLISYSHPFITFESTVSEGSYIRSLAQILCEKLEVKGALSYLKRLNEGEFKFENEKALNPLDFVDLPRNTYTGDKEWFDLGRKLNINFFENKDDGEYLIVFDDFFSIIQIKDLEPKYIINKIEL